MHIYASISLYITVYTSLINIERIFEGTVDLKARKDAQQQLTVRWHELFNVATMAWAAPLALKGIYYILPWSTCPAVDPARDHVGRPAKLCQTGPSRQDLRCVRHFGFDQPQ